jgi:hypothetical protein
MENTQAENSEFGKKQRGGSGPMFLLLAGLVILIVLLKLVMNMLHR